MIKWLKCSLAEILWGRKVYIVDKNVKYQFGRITAISWKITGKESR